MAVTSNRNTSQPRFRTALFVIGPLLLLIAVITLFLATDGAGLNIAPVVPEESIQLDRPILKPGTIEIPFRNTSQEAVTISQININDAIWPYTISQNPVPRLQNATIALNYPWVEGDPYEISVISANSILFDASIEAAAVTKTNDGGTLGKFTLVGLYVGIIPVVLGMLWLPVLGNMSPSWLIFLMAATVGLLIFLGIDAVSEAIDQAGTLGEPYQGLGIVGIGIVLTFALLQAIGQRQEGTGKGGNRRLAFATMIAIGIGLHNLGEGMAIGASYAVGAATLGTFLVIGFIVQNITEGFGIVVPLARHQPTLQRLLLLGVIAGGPAIVGAWIGGLSSSAALAVLFLAIGAGAVFQVAWAIGRELVWKRETSGGPQRLPLTAFSGLATGMIVLYVMGVFVK